MDKDASAFIVVSRFDSDDIDYFRKVVGRKRVADDRYGNLNKFHKTEKKMASASSCFSISSGSRLGGSDDWVDLDNIGGNEKENNCIENDLLILNKGDQFPNTGILHNKDKDGSLSGFIGDSKGNEGNGGGNL